MSIAEVVMMSSGQFNSHFRTSPRRRLALLPISRLTTYRCMNGVSDGRHFPSVGQRPHCPVTRRLPVSWPKKPTVVSCSYTRQNRCSESILKIRKENICIHVVQEKRNGLWHPMWCASPAHNPRWKRRARIHAWAKCGLRSDSLACLVKIGICIYSSSSFSSSTTSTTPSSCCRRRWQASAEQAWVALPLLLLQTLPAGSAVAAATSCTLFSQSSASSSSFSCAITYAGSFAAGSLCAWMKLPRSVLPLESAQLETPDLIPLRLRRYRSLCSRWMATRSWSAVCA